MREVRVIPAIREFATGQGFDHLRPKRKVAGYARVSTDRDDQFASYEAQVDYYTTMIKANVEWEFVGIYTDEGISGTSTNRREGFKQMISDALSGKIDLIVTKSVSRFARNTVDSLTTIRSLKENKVEVYFEKENIKTFDSKGELLITIMSSIAQEESRSISENVKWGRRKRFADGIFSLPYSHFLGYDRGPEGTLVVNPEQARTVRYIYALFLQGMSFNGIAAKLTAEGFGTPGGQARWHDSTVSGILSNEKYKGDALLQKYYIPDFLTKKAVVNKGEVPQYYVQGNHEAIIDPEIFDLVQQ
ncbi:MAG: recombinase family protein, partial [Gammaproteobacteria bacterium]|nr:recombinase family protein [Gammaproteobacteria bacterium]